MFCPGCATENGSEQGFCRRCGLSLSAVRMASEGRLDEALLKLGKGSGRISTGLVVILVGLLNALINNAMDAWMVAYLSGALGTAIGAPLIATGLSQVKQAKRLLNPPENVKGLPGAARAGEALAGATTRALRPGDTAADSVTEHTTLELDTSKTSRRD